MDDDAFELGKTVPLRQPPGGRNRRVCARFYAAMAFFKRLMAAHGGIRETALFLFGEEQFDVVTQGALVAFECEYIVGTLFDEEPTALPWQTQS